MVHSYLKYSASLWNPYRLGIIEDLERVQRRATKLIIPIQNLPYIERLKLLELPTLKFRRLRGDMIEVFKIVNGIYDVSVVPLLPKNLDTRTRDNEFKLLYPQSRLDLSKFCFDIDKHWLSQEVYYDYKADLII